MSTPEYQALDKEWSPKLSAAYDKINLNREALRPHRDALRASRAASASTPSRLRLLTRTYDGFVRRGAKLDAAQKAQLSAINQQLAAAFSDFNSQLLADEATLHPGERGRDGRRSRRT